jgi:putative PIN family toxin of toxin-antitoxin system
VRIVLDTSILVRAHEGANGPARELLLRIIESDHVLVTSDDILHELAKVLRYPRMLALHGLSEGRIYDYIALLRSASELVRTDPLLITPVRDVNDTIVMQTAIIGDAEVLCTKDQDFFDPPAQPFLQRADIEVLDDVPLLSRLRAKQQ